MTIVGRILCAMGRHDWRFCAGTGCMECIRPYCFATRSPDDSPAIARLEHAVTSRFHRGGIISGPIPQQGIPAVLLPGEFQLAVADDVKSGDIVTIDRATGQVRKAVAGVDERTFCVPPTAVIEGGILNIPQKDWAL